MRETTTQARGEYGSQSVRPAHPRGEHWYGPILLDEMLAAKTSFRESVRGQPRGCAAHGPTELTNYLNGGVLPTVPGRRYKESTTA